jgi:hypothetical protein
MYWITLALLMRLDDGISEKEIGRQIKKTGA